MILIWGLLYYLLNLYYLILVSSYVHIPAGACEKVVSDLRSGGGFLWSVRFPHRLQVYIRHEKITSTC